MDILTLYKGILESTIATVSEDGLVSQTLGDKSFPSVIGEKRLVLPIKAILDAGISPGTVAFHPMSENILRGESDVLKHLRQLMTIKLTKSAVDLAYQLMHIASDASIHAKLTPGQSELLSAVPDADPKVLDAFRKLLGSVDDVGERRLLNIYLKRGGMHKEVKVNRLAVVTFPFIEMLNTEGREIYGTTTTAKNKAAFRGVLNYIFPESEDQSKYSYGTSSQCAPYLHALLNSYINLAMRINAVTKKFKKQLSKPEDISIDLSWEEAAVDLTPFSNQIPALPGNDGETQSAAMLASEKAPATFVPLVSTIGNKSLATTATQPPAPEMVMQQAQMPVLQMPQQQLMQPQQVMQPQWQQPQQQVQVQSNQPLLNRAAGVPVPFDEIKQRQAQMAAPMMMPQQMPQFVQQQVMQQPQVRHNANGAIDFNSLVQANPMVAVQGNMMHMNYGNTQAMLQMQQPQLTRGGYAATPPPQMYYQPQQPQQQFYQQQQPQQYMQPMYSAGV